MSRAVIDTNILLIANEQHPDVTPECVVECVRRLRAIQRDGTVVIDDGYRVLGEYQHKTQLNPPKGVGDVFLKWLLRNAGNVKYCEQVALSDIGNDSFLEFPDQVLQPEFDAPDRKFAAVSNAHPEKPPVWQGADSKWLNWWTQLQAAGVRVEFVCPADACRFYANKFPGKPVPALPPGNP
ncbi:hypothetical protein [Pseudomonas sp. B392_1p]|uniref:hypothetical protein n=1 Tax=Pseudomonas sp. B392_1p TaxID=3457507 RepID=UPI003FCFB421